MSLCVVNPVEMHTPKINKCALKLIGIDNADFTDEELLEYISVYTSPTSIEALVYDFFNSFYVLFLTDIESTCRLVGKHLTFGRRDVQFLPLLDCYIVDNVYPSLKNEDLSDIFRTFGNVFAVTNHYAVPNSSRFSHVLSGKREITFLMPGKESEIAIPINVIHPPYSFHAKRFCCGCLTEGHSVLHCPDIEEDEAIEKEFYVCEKDSDREGDANIKSENIDVSGTCQISDTPLDGMRVVESVEFVENQSGLFAVNNQNVSIDKSSENLEDVSTSSGNHEKGTNTNKDASTEAVNANKDASTEAVTSSSESCDYDFSKISYDDIDDIVTRPSECTKRSDSPHTQPHPLALRYVSRVKGTLPPEAHLLIDEYCFESEASVVRNLLLIDEKNKSDIKEFVFNCRLDTDKLVKIVRRLVMECYQKKRYSCLLGPFSQKLHKFSNVISGLRK